MREHNLQLVLAEILRRGLTTRSQIGSATGLAKGSVSTLVRDLMDMGLVLDLGAQPDGERGRPTARLTLNRDAYAGLGLEVNVDYISACVTDLGHQVRYHKIETADNRLEPPALVLRRLVSLARGAMAAAQLQRLRVAGAVLALPGLVDAASGRVLRAPNLNWTDIAISGLLAESGLSDSTLRVDNEANLAALGELWFGVGIGYRSYVFVSGEIGVGAGIVVDGQIYRGAHGFSGEIGHVIIEPEGRPCGCGGRGCLEQYAGQEAMLRDAGLDMRPATSTGLPAGPIFQLHQRLLAADAAATAAVVRAGRALGIGLASVLNIIDTEAVVLGGIYAPLAPWLLEPVREELKARLLAAQWGKSDPLLVVSPLGPDAAVRGAAGRVVNDLLSSPGRLIDHNN
jgi:predicted NBD/HSP70 family sugar kinase